MKRVVFVVAILGCGPKEAPEGSMTARPEPADLAPRGDHVDEIAGLTIADPYRGLEALADDDAWLSARNASFQAHTDAMPQREELYDRFQRLWRYDDATIRRPCLLSDRQVWRTKRADQDKWVVHLAEGPDDEGRVVVDPNTWDTNDQLARFTPSADCRYAVVGKAKAGDENAVLKVLDLDDGTFLDDTFRGWKQGGVSWKHDNSGFYYSAKPLQGEVEGDNSHFYNHRAWWHTLGTQGDADVLVLHSDDDKNLWHGASVSEDGRWLLEGQSLFNQSRDWITDLTAKRPERKAIIEELEARVWARVVDDTLLITTDLDAPNMRVMAADPRNPGKDQWRELIPEREDVLKGVTPAAGKLYATYQRDASTAIVVFDLEGNELHEVPLPTLGTASVWGRWDLDEVQITFQSFAVPSTVYTHDTAKNELVLLKSNAMPVEQELLDRISVDRVWFTSKDGTRVPMFVVHTGQTDGPVPTLLTGYGGFNISMRPRFSTTALTWVERGGAYALPNLRGGGEFGKAWHEAGMRERKQNVFDDFLGAAQWLLAEGWTTPEQLAISGGSNGGLLVSAAVTQAPELFGAVLCSVPLTDMVRFHTFGIADIWTEEYGSPEDPEMLPHLHAYSPYHAVRDGVDYPAILVVGSANDARTDPVHATKFAAAVRHADRDRGTEQPILLTVRSDSGHGGGVGIDVRADQKARNYGFLMAEVGL
ncbi:MAG: prolyl oligopeptidase family serine peptidase [Myxococcales bacterium]|nr:prolyl oligopeptidase family serine peptidase [Myxococcales bacterium]